MSVVRLPSGVLAQFATNVELVTNASTNTGGFEASGYRYLPEREPDSAMDGKYFITLERITERDPHWGTGENIQHGIVTVQTSYYRGGGDAGEGDRQSVMRNAADDCQILGDVCENPENYNPTVTGIRRISCTGSTKVHDLKKAEVWETTFSVEWRSDLATTPVIVPSGGGVSVLSVSGEFQSTNTDGTEDIVGVPLTVDFDDFTFANVKIRLAAWVYVTAGTGTYRVRLGGTKGAADGTIVAEMTTTGTSYDLATDLGDAFAIPSGVQTLQVTFSNGTTNETAFIDGIGVAILDGDA